MSAVWLICYDITSPRRLVRLHRALKKRAMPIQYSVFLGRFTAAGMAELQQVITAIIDPKQDDVRMYPLPANGWRMRMGQAVLPEGIFCTLLPNMWEAAASAPKPAPAPKPQPASPPADRKVTARMQTGQRRGIQLF